MLTAIYFTLHKLEVKRAHAIEEYVRIMPSLALFAFILYYLE